MFTVRYYDDSICEDVEVFEGSLAECIAYIEADKNRPDYDDDLEPYFIVEPDGYTVYGDDED